MRTVCLTLTVLASIIQAAKAEPVVLETDDLRLTIGDDGVIRSLVSKPTGKEYLSKGPCIPFATVYRGGRSVPSSHKRNGEVTQRWVYQGGEQHSASAIALQGDQLRVDFTGVKTTAEFRVITTPNHLALELLEMSGEPVDRIDWLCLNLGDLPNRGEWVNFAFNDQFGVCLCAGNVRTNVEMDQAPTFVTMRAVAERTVGFEGTTAVLFGCSDPRHKFLDAMDVVEQAFDMPHGAGNRRQPGQRLSYLWASRPTPDNIDQYIEVAKQAGLRMILLSYTSFAKGAGHFAWRKEYPRGMADLKQVTDAIRSAGLKVGWHIHYSKARKTDRYVTPIPDDRLHQVRRFTLAEDVDSQSNVLLVNEDPSGCTLDDERRILKIGKELISYEGFSNEPPFAFTGCQRGHLGTTASHHAKADNLGLLNVDTWTIFIRLDQDTDIQDEVAARIGEIYRQTGPYEMIYFDGAEDVHPPFWYHVASAQQRVFRQLDPAPPVCESALYCHYSWHMISRSNAYDVVAPATGMKDFCRLMPCPTAAERVKDFSRIEFGWLGRFGDKDAGPDVWEYIASRAAAWDCPISLHVSLKDVAANPRRQDCLEAIRTWEDARLGNHLTDAQRAELRIVSPDDAHYVPCYDQRGIWENIATDGNLTPVQRRILANREEHHLFLNEQGQYELVPIQELPVSDAIKAFSFQRTSRPDDTYVLLWAVEGNVNLQLPLAADSIGWMRPFGTSLDLQQNDGRVGLTVNARSYLIFRGLNVDETTELLASAFGLTM